MSPSANQPAGPSARKTILQSKWSRRLALGAIASGAFWVNSELLFAVLGLAPRSPRWPFVSVLAGLWTIAAAGIALQNSPLPPKLRQLLGCASGTASGAVLGFYGLGQLMGQQQSWAIAGALAGGLGLGAVAIWAFGPGPAARKAQALSAARRRFWRLALGLVGGCSAYGLAFGLGAWTWGAVQAGRWPLGLGLGLLTLLALGMTRRSLHGLGQPPEGHEPPDSHDPPDSHAPSRQP